MSPAPGADPRPGHDPIGLRFLFWELGLVAWALLASYIVLGRHGHLDWTHHALGRDFVNSWTAGQLVWRGDIADIFDPRHFLTYERQLFDRRLPFHFWSYPPPNLFLVAPLGLLGYFPGLAAWSVAGVAALVPAAGLWSDRPWLRLSLLAAPAVATNIGLGQNGAFTAALLISGLCLIDTRPLFAGALLGLLIFKPQIAVLAPVVVLAGRRWRTLWAAVAVVATVLALSTLVFGWDAWRGFFGPTLTTQGIMLKQGRGPFQWMMPSAYMSARILGARWPMAALAQTPFTLAAAGVTAWAWMRRDRPLELRAALVMVATFVASPQAFNYDLIPASAAALVLWRRDPIGWLGLPLALLVWAAPVAMVGLKWIDAPVAPLILTAAMVRLALLLARAPPGVSPPAPAGP